MGTQYNKTEYEKKSSENQYVTFTLGPEIYGIKVTAVQEIIGMTLITHLPNSRKFMRGMINLRGSAIPVLDMRLLFEMEERPYDAFTVIIIVESNEHLLGMIVDTVSDVSHVPAEAIQETPQFTTKIETDYIDGIGRIGESLIILLDVGKILTDEVMINTSETVSAV